MMMGYPFFASKFKLKVIEPIIQRMSRVEIVINSKSYEKLHIAPDRWLYNEKMFVT